MIKEATKMQIGDIVYILGKYTFDSAEKPQLLEVKISHIKHRQFIAYRTDDGPGEWPFSKKHLGKCVFLTYDEAEKALKEGESN